MGKEIKKYPSIHTIRYMGNKTNLLDFIIPIVKSVTNEGDSICDLMCGTSSIGYALSNRNSIVSNDLQKASSVVSKALLITKRVPLLNEIHSDIDGLYHENMESKLFRFFYDVYSDTYFSPEQCLQIDSIRYAIEKVSDDKKDLYLTFLMSAMCKAQSTPGHFAQFLKKDSKRVQPLRKYDLLELFYEKASEFQTLQLPRYSNHVYNMNYSDLFDSIDLSDIKCFYLDPPYTSDQYSRFYHLLETVCLYDSPKTFFKAKYREDRKMSGFCYKKTVYSEFDKIIKFASENNSSLIISYSNHGVADPNEILNIGKKYYNNCKLIYENYNHSSQGNGKISILECLIVFK